MNKCMELKEELEGVTENDYLTIISSMTSRGFFAGLSCPCLLFLIAMPNGPPTALQAV